MVKNLIILFSFLALLLSCNKEASKTEQSKLDKTKPVITLMGKQWDTLFLMEGFIEPGYKGIDDVDGDITPFVVVSGNYNIGVRGDFVKAYDLRDGAGNYAMTQIRHIHRKNRLDFLVGNYSANCNCKVFINDTLKGNLDTNYSANLIASDTYNYNGELFYYGKPCKNVEVGAFTNLINLSFGGMGSGTISPNYNSFTTTTTQFFGNARYDCTIKHIRK